MSLRKDSFERILAFSKSEEAKNMDMETTRWLWQSFFKPILLQVFEEEVRGWKEEWSWTHWRRAWGVQDGQKKDRRAEHCLQVEILDKQSHKYFRMTILLTSGLAWVKTLRTSGWRKKSLLECLRILCPLSKDVLLESWRLWHFKKSWNILKHNRWPPRRPTTVWW